MKMSLKRSAEGKEARSLLNIIVAARRPLILEEMDVALVVHHDEVKLRHQESTKPDDEKDEDDGKDKDDEDDELCLLALERRARLDPCLTKHDGWIENHSPQTPNIASNIDEFVFDFCKPHCRTSIHHIGPTWELSNAHSTEKHGATKRLPSTTWPPPTCSPLERTNRSEQVTAKAEHFDAEDFVENSTTIVSHSDKIIAWVPAPPGWPRNRHVFHRHVNVILGPNRTSTDSGYSSKSSSGDQDGSLTDASSVSRTELPTDSAQHNELTNAFSSTDKDCYQYGNLPSSNAFRLLRIWNKSKPIHCTLEPYDLTNHPDYYALSYKWGTTEEELVISAAIIVDFHQMKITPNLYNFLAHWQSSNRAMPLWVDALCINQCDTVHDMRYY